MGPWKALGEARAVSHDHFVLLFFIWLSNCISSGPGRPGSSGTVDFMATVLTQPGIV